MQTASVGTFGGLLGGGLLGASLMFLLDPDRGRRRRALIAGKAVRATHSAQRAAEKISRDVSNRAEGMQARVRHMGEQEQVTDSVLVQRVRTQLGRCLSHPRAVRARASEGSVILEGDVLRSELRALISGVSSVRGVRGVKSLVHVHESAEAVPALQGEKTAPSERRRIARRDAETRFLAAVLGGIGAAILTRGRGPKSSLLVVAGAALAAGSAVGSKPARGTKAIGIHKTMNIRCSPDELFTFWSDFENFPKFMPHIKEVKKLDERRSEWRAVAKGIGVRWTAEITEVVPGRTISWRSAPGSWIENHGTVSFAHNGRGGTQLDVRICYHPPLGALAHAAAQVFGADPKTAMDDDLARLKTLMEVGHTRRVDGRSEERPPAF